MLLRNILCYCYSTSKKSHFNFLFLHDILSIFSHQSEERWRSSTQDAAIHNFQLHAFRAAFQLVKKSYPMILQVHLNSLTI